MKNILKVGIFFGVVLLLTGFGTKGVKCTKNNDQGASGYTINSTYEIVSSGDKVSKVEIEEVITSKNNTTLAYFEDRLKKQYEDQNKKYKGYTVKTKTEKGKTIVNVTIDYSKFDVEKFANDNDIIKSDIKKSKNMTSDIAKKYYESLGTTCK